MILKRSIPIHISIMMDIGSFAIMIFFITYYEKDPSLIASIGMGSMTNNLVLRSFVLGFDNGLSTILSQAYGSRRYKELTDTINRARVFFMIGLMPLLFLLFFTEEILLFLGQPKNISYEAGIYVRISMFGFIFHLNFDIYRKFLNAIRKSNTYVIFPYFTFSLSFLWSYLFIIKFDWGIVGAGLISLLNPITNFALGYFSINYFDIGSDFLKWPNKDAFNGWGKLFSFGISTYFLQISAMIAIDGVVVMSGYLDEDILVANVSLINILWMICIATLSLQIVSAALIGNKVGEGDYDGTI